MASVVVRWRRGSLEQTTATASGSRFRMGMLLVMTRIVRLTSFLLKLTMTSQKERMLLARQSIKKAEKKRKLKQKNKGDE